MDQSAGFGFDCKSLGARNAMYSIIVKLAVQMSS